MYICVSVFARICNEYMTWTMYQSSQIGNFSSLTSSLCISCLITSSGSIVFASDRQLFMVIKLNQQTRRPVVRTCSQRKALLMGNLLSLTFSLFTDNEVGRRDFSSFSAIFQAVKPQQCCSQA